MGILQPLLLLAIFGFVRFVLSETVKINTLGDSITGSPGCWRNLLWEKLHSAGIVDIDFVGTLPAKRCGFDYDGVSTDLATGIANQNLLPLWHAQTQPDIVMMFLGTNDIWNGVNTSTILEAYSILVDQMRSQKENVNILLAQITPMSPDGCTTCTEGVVNLDIAIPAWAASKSTVASPITVVDCFTGFDIATDTEDGVHPNSSGDKKLASSWFAPLKEAIIAIGGPTEAMGAARSLPTIPVPGDH